GSKLCSTCCGKAAVFLLPPTSIAYHLPTSAIGLIFVPPCNFLIILLSRFETVVGIVLTFVEPAFILRFELTRLLATNPCEPFILNGLRLVCIFTASDRSEEHTSELQSRFDLVCRLLLEKKKNTIDVA